ncbi:vesicular inhibitory amino acid transporter [Daktulosphaira vitifoliae]|uniref:vesicular inhibitory amino acid transporter n=1 Tax=Daktulosphaira vitifoliae TaxID=58002 RepID=UPI0021AA25CD|nr:vesicular inhibitory amino acid transporter [Daktulosphaira vitifoliae]
MAQFGRFYVPPLNNAMNVMWAAFRAYVPDDSPCLEAIRKRRGGAGEEKSSGDNAGPAEKSRLAGGKPDTNPFRTTCNAELSSYGGVDNPGLDVAGDGVVKRTPQTFSMDGSFDEDSSGGGEFGGHGRHKIDEWQAAWNVTNAIQGMFIVSLPFAVLRGGYWAIAAMIGIAYICCYTGKILVECLYELDLNTGQRVRVRDSYVSIARECFGPVWGGRAVNLAQMIELLMTCILYVVVCGDLMEGTFPDGVIDTRSWMLITGVLLIPLGFLKHLHHVSLLSFWCTMSHILINIIILGYCVLELPDWGWSKVKWTIDVENFPISLGVIVFSYTSQIFLPTLEGNLIDRSKFDWMLDWSHIAAAIFKSLFGYICFLTFQNDTQQVITNNLQSPSFKGLVNVFLVVKALLSYPLPYYAACDILEKSFFKGPPTTQFPSIWHLDGELKVWGLAFRVAIILGTVFMAISIPHFAILMGFIGSFTGTMLSFIWPCYFHLKLKGDSLEWRTIMFDCFVIFLGCLFGVIGVYDSGSAMVKAFQIGLPF